MKYFYSFLVFLLLLVIIYFLGPKPNYKKVDAKFITSNLKINELANFILQKEKNINIKPNCNSKIVWAGKKNVKTKYAIVYLHGFSASPQEGNPVHINTAKKYGMNLYLPLLAAHGIDDKESFANTTPQDLVNSAIEAIAIGKKIGEKVIVMSCSTGSTLANLVAAENPNLIEAQIMYSPNFGIVKTGASLANKPWGLSLLRTIFSSKYRSIPGANENVKKYWTHTYRLEGIALTVDLIEQMMQKNKVEKINHPVLIGCYYINEEKQDKVVSIPKMEKYLSWIATPKNNKQLIKFDKVGSHVLTNAIYSKDVESVLNATNNFIETKILN